MEKITYVLGAGFSAPAGLPLMNNFILKAKDLYYENPERFKYFLRIFSKIEDLSKIKNFFRADLYNIEEVLSLFETESILNRNTKFKSEFIKFIADVIDSYTFDKLDFNFNPKVSNYHGQLLGSTNIKKMYAAFISCVCGIQILRNEERNNVYFKMERIPNNQFKYSIITLNYDTLLENCLDSLINEYHPNDDIRLLKDKYDSDWDSPHLVKLHGCIKNQDIIPPTWAKSTTPNIEKTWRNAYNVIKDSTQIRFIGYSLPVTDSNVRYLIKSAILKNQALKKIDVLCLDTPNQLNKTRFDEFIDFNYYNYLSMNAKDYLYMIMERSLHPKSNLSGIRFDDIEYVHQNMFK